jgi:hypothetical protein
MSLDAAFKKVFPDVKPEKSPNLRGRIVDLQALLVEHNTNTPSQTLDVKQHEKILSMIHDVVIDDTDESFDIESELNKSFASAINQYIKKISASGAVSSEITNFITDHTKVAQANPNQIREALIAGMSHPTPTTIVKIASGKIADTFKDQIKNLSAAMIADSLKKPTSTAIPLSNSGTSTEIGGSVLLTV